MGKIFSNPLARGATVALGGVVTFALILYAADSITSTGRHIVGTVSNQQANTSAAFFPRAIGGADIAIEADVFTNTTLVKVERGTATEWYETKTREREVLIKEIAGYLGLMHADVERVIDFQIENRSSRPEDRD